MSDIVLLNTLINTGGVAGTDGIVPVYDPAARWCGWNLAEVWTGGPGDKRYVPKVNDYVYDLPNSETYIVRSLNPTTLVPVLELVTGPVSNGQLTDEDMLLGVGPGTISDTYRVYIDKSVLPYTMSVDKRLRTFGTMASTAKIFRGSDLTGGAKVISAFYNQNGTLMGQSIPLELVVMPNGANKSTKSVPTCYTSEDLPDGEVVTIVVYADDGHVVSKCSLLVENTAFITTADASAKYITGIGLETPFLSESDPNKIQYPLNVPLIGLSLTGVVHYSDGSALKMPVDQTKFSIYGFNNFVSTVVGQPVPLVLNYQLSDGEIVYGATVGEKRNLTRSYKAVTTNSEGVFTPKLYGYPVWIDPVQGYRLEWFLYDLDRNLATLVTPHVKINTNSAPFQPIAYGIKQTLGVSINLRDVNPTGISYLHVQTIDIILRQQGNARTSNWAIGFDPGQVIFFGENNHATMVFVNENLRKINITCGETVLDTWLARIYSMTKPLTDPVKEITAPRPNYFSLAGTNWEVAYPLDQWNKDMVISNQVADSGTLFIKFFQRTADTDIQLSVAALPVYQVTA
jgi:hypothetical protein